MSHLSVLVTALRRVRKWFPLGIHLGLSYSTLKIIEPDYHDEGCIIEMLVMWLRGPEEKRNKQFLQRALQRLTTSQPVLSRDTSSE